MAYRSFWPISSLLMDCYLCVASFTKKDIKQCCPNNISEWEHHDTISHIRKDMIEFLFFSSLELRGSSRCA